MLDVKVQKEKDFSRISFSGRIDNEGAVVFQQTLDQAFESGSLKIILDFIGLEFINSSGIGKLLIFYKKMINSGRISCIEGINEEILTLFKAIRLDKIIDIKR